MLIDISRPIFLHKVLFYKVILNYVFYEIFIMSNVMGKSEVPGNAMFIP